MSATLSPELEERLSSPLPECKGRARREFRYYCAVCHVTFYDEAARRHRAHNERMYRESGKPTAMQRVL